MATEWRALYIDDDPDYLQQIKEILSGAKVLEPDHILSIETIEYFDNAIPELENRRYDLVIIDLRLGDTSAEVAEEEGIKTLESIQSRIFLPVIFYTVIPRKLEDLSSHLIRVVDKKDGPEKLLEEIMEIFKTKLPIINRELIRYVQDVQRDYMWDFVESNWEKFGDTPDRSALAYLLARRLAKSLDGPGIEKLAERLGDTSRLYCDEEHVHPMRYYVIPPISPRLMSGDIFLRKTDEKEAEYLVLLSPTCDIPVKVEWMLFARCLVLTGEDEYTRFKENTENSKKIEALIKDRREDKQWERFKFMPGAIDIPDMIVDFQQLMALKKDEFEKSIGENKIERIASLDSPYCEALTAQFARYFGRIGTPDLNKELIIENLRNQVAKADSGNV